MFTNDEGKDVFIFIQKTVGGSFDKHLVVTQFKIFEHFQTFSVFGNNNFKLHLVECAT